MKKTNLFSLVALATMTLSGCSNDEVVNDYSPENAIQFGTYVGRNATSRASVITADELATQGFGVFAYYTGNNDFNTTTATPNFMYNQKVLGVTGGTETAGNKTTSWSTGWTYSPIKYWPNNEGDKVSFFAYAPYTEQPTSGNGDTDYNIGVHSANTAAGFPSLTFYVNPTVKNQIDLLWADPVLNQTKQAVTEKVNFAFHHALARIGFSVQAMIDVVNEDSDGTVDDNKDVSGNFETDSEGEQITTVSVQSIKLSGSFYNAGTLSYSQGTDNNYTASFAAASCTTPENGITYTLSGADDNGNFESVANNVTLADTKLNKDDSYIMVIPCDFTSTGNKKLKLEIEYTVTTTDANLSGGKSVIKNNITKEFYITEGFTAGKAYNFSLHIGLTSVKLSATVDDWDTGTDYAVNVPINVAETDSEGSN